MKIKSDIRVAGIIGNPLRQSMSPLIHNYWIKKYAINAIYIPFQINSIISLNEAIKTFNLVGLNVTIPFKKKVFQKLDRIDKAAEKINAVNTIVNKNKILKGYNTDIYGFGKGLEARINWNKKRPIYIFGAGGAAEAIAYYFHKLKIHDITIVNRTKSKAKKLATKYKGMKFTSKINTKIFREAGLVVNTTSLGMIGYPDLNLNLRSMNREAIIYDIVYNPENTKLLREAKKHKIDTVSGLDMFIEQAKRSFELWFDIKPEIDKKFLFLLRKEIKQK